ncbi:MAG: phasin family protein [Pseudomonadota bacterium]|nr:phasin family protein [Pseudomonadota bacterium]
MADKKPDAHNTDQQNNAGKMRDTIHERIVDPMKRAGEAMRDSGAKIAENGSAIGAKVIDQAESNAREAFSAMRAAAGAKDLSEVMSIQGEFLREQGARSMAQAREIGELIMQFGREAVAPLRGDKS